MNKLHVCGLIIVAMVTLAISGYLLNTKCECVNCTCPTKWNEDCKCKICQCDTECKCVECKCACDGECGCNACKCEKCLH